jgi:hypothetical protein
MLAFFYLFDGLFFFGSLQGRINLLIEKESYQETKGYRGITSGDSKIRMALRMKQKRQRIIMWRDEKSSSRLLLLLGYIGTLLHEMIRAFFALWACDCCRRAVENGGLTGHGRAWQDLALALETAYTDHRLLGIVNMCLGRQNSLAFEVSLSGDRQANLVLRQRWDLNPDTLDYEVEWYTTWWSTRKWSLLKGLLCWRSY